MLKIRTICQRSSKLSEEANDPVNMCRELEMEIKNCNWNYNKQTDKTTYWREWRMAGSQLYCWWWPKMIQSSWKKIGSTHIVGLCILNKSVIPLAHRYMYNRSAYKNVPKGNCISVHGSLIVPNGNAQMHFQSWADT